MPKSQFLGRILFVAFCGLFLAIAPASADVIGQVATFNVDVSYDAKNAASMTATLRAIGTRGYFYVDDRAWAALSDSARSQFTQVLDQLSRQFDDTIYPRSTALWGFENTPGIDGDSHVVILLEQLIAGAGGYFDSSNGYSVNQVPRSNAREMIVVGFDSVLQGTANTFLAHEFQHLITFNQKELLQNVHDDIWANEGRSEYNVTVAGYNESYPGSTLERRTSSFVRNPSDSLVEWTNSTIDYGNTAIFFHYLGGRFGQSLLQRTMPTRAVGVQALSEALGGKFSETFTDWMVASYLNDRSMDARYGYALSGLSSLRVPVQIAQSFSTGSRVLAELSLKEWQPVWLQLSPSGGSMPPEATVTVTAPGNQASGAVIALYGGGTRTILSWATVNGTAVVSVPTTTAGASLQSMVIAATQGTLNPVDGRTIGPQTVTIAAALGAATTTIPLTTPTPTPSQFQLDVPHDGDLIRHNGEAEIYVVWGPYRRFMTTETLRLYGFQDRRVLDVSDDVFNRYKTSNYVRAINQQKVYAVWPDGTKHWLNITAAQWDASGRDWGAIFTVNDSEVNFYRTGVEITR